MKPRFTLINAIKPSRAFIPPSDAVSPAILAIVMGPASSFIETFPMHLFKMLLPENSFPRSGPITIKYYGVGYDPEAWVRDGGIGHSFTRA